MPKNQQWILYSTLGCHLCEDAKRLIEQATAVIEVAVQTVDIVDLPEAQMRQWADKIPVLASHAGVLCYPFSLADIMALAEKNGLY